jgi:hypothetical protein
MMVDIMNAIEERVDVKGWLKYAAITTLTGVVGGYVLSWVWYFFHILFWVVVTAVYSG